MAWESSQNLGTPPLVFLHNDVWRWLQKFPTGDVMCHYPDPDPSPVVSLCLSLVARGVWWLPTPAARVTQRRLGTSQIQIWVVFLNAIYPLLTTNQKHSPDLGIGTSTVWNFCSHFLDVISQGNQLWCWKMSAVFSGYLTVECNHVGRHRPRCRLWKSKFKFFHIISFWPPSWISGKATKVAYFLLKLKNRVLNIKLKHIGTKNMTFVYSRT